MALITAALCATLAFLVGASPASAYVETGIFAGGGPGPGGSGSEDGYLSNPGQAAVNDATGELYVADTGNDRVQVFKPTATAAEYDSQAAVTAPTGIAIDQATGDVYVSTATGVSKFDQNLAPIAVGWTDPGVTGRLAVDPATGDLLLADTAANLIRRFNPDGSADGTFPALRPIDVAANSAGEIFVVTTDGDIGSYPCGSTSAVERFNGAGVSAGTLPSLTVPGAVAVDPDDDSIVVATHVNEYFCEQGNRPGIATFAADGTFEGLLELAPDTMYATVSGLATQGGGSNRAYALTKSPMNDPFGPTSGIALEVPPPTPPQVLGQSALRGVNEATLRATIDPGGLATEYRFEYGTSAAYGEETATQSLPKSNGGVPVSALISGLTPGVTYHYRVVVENSLGEAFGVDRTFRTIANDTGCPNAAFRTGAAAFLSDCRAYELVTPADSDANIRIGGGPASVDGNAVCFNTEDTLVGADPNGIKTADQGFCSWRGPDGWETKWVTGPVPPERIASMGSNVYYLSPDGQRAVFASDSVIFGGDFVAPPEAPHGSPVSAYMWEDGQTTWLAPGAPPVGDPPVYLEEGINRPENTNEQGSGNYRRPVGVSEDLTHGIFESSLPLVPSDENEAVDLYEWYPGGIRVVSTDASGKAAGGRAPIQAFLQMATPPGTVSADGSRIFFQHDGAPLAGEPGEAPEGPDPEATGLFPKLQSVYMREGEEITLVSPRRGGGPDASVWFAGASADGDLAYLETTQPLTAEAKEPGRAIYSYDVPSDELELVADAPGGVKLITSSTDASTIVYYEIASRQLIVERNGVSTPLGVLTESDIEVANRVASERIDERALRITGDGSVVVFAAAGDFGAPGTGRIQIFRWEAGAGLERISADGDAVPAANASIGAYPALTGNPREELFANHRARANVGRVMSDDGSRVFFETTEALVNRDVNGLTDVYEWHDGDVNLVSTGTGGNAFYHENSADGGTVFITTIDRLLPSWDRNAKRDVYVARPGGGLPPPPSPPDCGGEACQPPRPAPPASESGSSSGEGNVSPGRRAAYPTALGRKQLARLANGAGAIVKVRVTEPGTVFATLRGKVGGRARAVAKASRSVRKPGTVGLRLKLSNPGLSQLRQRGKLRLTLVVAHSNSELTATRKVVLHDQG